MESHWWSSRPRTMTSKPRSRALIEWHSDDLTGDLFYSCSQTTRGKSPLSTVAPNGRTDRMCAVVTCMMHCARSGVELRLRVGRHPGRASPSAHSCPARVRAVLMNSTAHPSLLEQHLFFRVHYTWLIIGAQGNGLMGTGRNVTTNQGGLGIIRAST